MFAGAGSPTRASEAREIAQTLKRLPPHYSVLADMFGADYTLVPNPALGDRERERERERATGRLGPVGTGRQRETDHGREKESEYVRARQRLDLDIWVYRANILSSRQLDSILFRKCDGEHRVCHISDLVTCG